MVAILEPHRHDRHTASSSGRPTLQLVRTDSRSNDNQLVELGVSPYQLVVVIAALVLAAVLALAVGNGAFSSLSSPASGGEATSAPHAGQGETLMVQPGDTLWSIAQTLQPNSDPRPIVDELVRLNGNEPLQVGEHIFLPTAG